MPALMDYEVFTVMAHLICGPAAAGRARRRGPGGRVPVSPGRLWPV